MSIEIFDRGSRDFTRQTDAAVAEGAYLRGRLFADAIAAGTPAGEVVLDYGCGPGRIGAMIADRGFRVDGRDPSPLMLAEARKLPHDPERISFSLATGHGEALLDGHYGAIVCSSVIEFVPEPARLLRHFHRATKPGALLALSFSNRRSLWGAYARWRYEQPHFAVQFNVWTFQQTRTALAENGFRVISAPVYYEASPFDKRPPLKFLSASVWVGTLGFITARRIGA
jgi:SAM-dependent methyltransferase